MVQRWYIVQVNDGRGIENPLNLFVEIRGCRGEDGREQKGTIDACCMRGVNSSGEFGYWAFSEFRDEWESETVFERLVAETSGKLVVDRG